MVKFEACIFLLQLLNSKVATLFCLPTKEELTWEEKLHEPIRGPQWRQLAILLDRLTFVIGMVLNAVFFVVFVARLWRQHTSFENTRISKAKNEELRQLVNECAQYGLCGQLWPPLKQDFYWWGKVQKYQKNKAIAKKGTTESENAKEWRKTLWFTNWYLCNAFGGFGKFSLFKGHWNNCNRD